MFRYRDSCADPPPAYFVRLWLLDASRGCNSTAHASRFTSYTSCVHPPQ